MNKSLCSIQFSLPFRTHTCTHTAHIHTHTSVRCTPLGDDSPGRSSFVSPIAHTRLEKQVSECWKTSTKFTSSCDTRPTSVLQTHGGYQEEIKFSLPLSPSRLASRQVGLRGKTNVKDLPRLPSFWCVSLHYDELLSCPGVLLSPRDCLGSSKRLPKKCVSIYTRTVRSLSASSHIQFVIPCFLLERKIEIEH